MNKLVCSIIIMAVCFQLNTSYAYHPSEYYSEENAQYNTVTESYVTPHLKWAKPYLGGRLRVLIFAPRWGMRETVELMQRMDIEATVFATGTKDELGLEDGGGDETWEGFSYHTRVRELEELVEKDWDAVVFAGHMPFPWRVNGRFLEKIRDDGLGLLVMPELSFGSLFTHHDTVARDRILKPIPIENIPVMNKIGRDKILLVAQYGKGRIAHLKTGGGANGCFSSDVSDPVDFEYSLALVIRTILWIADREPPVEIGGVEWEKTIEVSVPGEIQVKLDHSKTAGLTPLLDILRQGEMSLPDAITASDINGFKSSDGYRFSLPHLSEGRYFFNIRLGSEDVQADWFSGAFDVTSKTKIDSIVTDRISYRRDETVQGKIFVSRKVSEGTAIHLSLIDGFGRLTAKKSIEGVQGQTVFGFQLPLKDFLHNALIIKAGLDVDGSVVSSKKCEVFAPALSQDDFMFVMWDYNSSNENRVTELLADRMWKDFYIDAIDLWVNKTNLYNLMRANLSPLPYVSRIAYLGGDPTNTAPVRTPSLTDSTYRNSLKSKIQEYARMTKDFSPVGYTLGDENFVSDYSRYTRGIDVDFHPSSLVSFRSFLKEKYNSLEKLNRVWNTSITSWQDAIPIIQIEALRSGQYARWIDHRLHMDSAFAEIHKWAGDRIREENPVARVGFDGTSAMNSFHGYDFYKLMQVNRVQNIYDQREQRELLRSFAPRNALTGIWLGSYWAHRTENQQRHYPWLMLLHGMNSCWYWLPYGQTSQGSAMFAVAPDLTPSFHFKWCIEELREIKSGIGKLIMNCERLQDGIAVHYSMASLHASSLDHTMSFVPDAQSNFVTLIEDAGFQYNFTATQQIEEGILGSGEYKILVLPCSQVITEKEEKEIRAFVQNGGLLVADVRPGFLGNFGNPESKGILNDVFGIAQAGKGKIGHSDLDVSGDINGKSVRFSIPDRELDGAITTGEGKALASSGNVPAVIVNRYGKGGTVLFNFHILDYAGTEPIPVVFPVPMKGTMREKGNDTGLKELVRSSFQMADVIPPVIMKTGIEELKAVETVFFEENKNRYLGILRSHHTEDLNPHEAHIKLPSQRHVYDARKGIYLGETDQISAKVSSARALLFSLLPYRVQEMNLKVPKSAERGKHLNISLNLKTDGKAGLHIIHLELCDPTGKEVPYFRKNVSAPGGKGKASIPIAMNETAGKWTVTARDAATGVTRTEVFRVK